jgi:general secretion pathway protein I
VEVLVAFAIVSLSLAVMVRIFSTGAQSTKASDAATIATLFAESSLASIGIEAPLREGEDSGALDGGFRWHSSV